MLASDEKREMVREALELLSQVGEIVRQLNDPWLDAYLCNEFEPSSEEGSHFGGTADKLAYFASNLDDDDYEPEAA